MHYAGAGFGQIDLFTFGQVCRRILYKIIIRIPVNTQHNRGFQLTRGGLAAYKKTESQLVAVVSRLSGRRSEVSIMYFTALNMFAITPEGQRHE